MNYVLVQIAKRYLCITACETVGEAAANGTANKGNSKKQADPNEKKAYSFSSPLIIPVDKAVLKRQKLRMGRPCFTRPPCKRRTKHNEPQ